MKFTEENLFVPEDYIGKEFKLVTELGENTIFKFKSSFFNWYTIS